MASTQLFQTRASIILFGGREKKSLYTKCIKKNTVVLNSFLGRGDRENQNILWYLLGFQDDKYIF